MRSIYISITSNGIDVRSLNSFERSLYFLHCHIIQLVEVINGSRYEAAWLERRELLRALNLAEPYAERTSDDGRDRTALLFRELKEVAIRVMEHAPDPSPEAILEARAMNWDAGCRIWEREESAWRAQRAESAPLVLKLGPPGTLSLTLETASSVCS